MFVNFSMDIERSMEILSTEDLNELYLGSLTRLVEYYDSERGLKWKELYNIKKPKNLIY